MMEAIAREFVFDKFSGTVVQIGRQTWEQEEKEFLKMLNDFGISCDFFQNLNIEVDCLTTQARQKPQMKFINDKTFFRAFGVNDVRAVDFTDSEGATIICDLNKPIPKNLEEIADLVVDGSTLDNVYDPCLALQNYNRMLKPKGRLISINAGKPDVHGGYTGMSAEWFLDYYAINNFSDCRVYGQFNNFESGKQGFAYLDYEWVLTNQRAPSYHHQGMAFTIIFAEKCETSTWERIPTRSIFRSKHETNIWVESVKKFAKSHRPIHLPASYDLSFRPYEGFVKI